MFFNKCACCGKSGLFFKVNFYHYCDECEKKLLAEYSNFVSGTSIFDQPLYMQFLKIRHEFSKTDIWRKRIPYEYFQKLKQVAKFYETYFSKFKYKKYILNSAEIVYVIDETFVAYLGIQDTLSISSTNPEYLNNHPIDSYKIKIEELTYNDKFKFILTKFQSNFHNSYSLFNFMKFEGTPYLGWQQSEYNYLNKRLPELNLDDRYKQWQGFDYKFIVFEISDKDTTEYAVCATASQITHKVALKKCEELLHNVIFISRQKDFPLQLHYWSAYGFISTNYFNHVAYNLLQQAKCNKNFSGDNIVKFFIINERVKNLLHLEDIKKEILTQARLNKYADIEKYIYVSTPNIILWKSEYILKEICEKLYGKRNVEYQYHPFFLGQQSYDIYLPKYKIAIEYQGKQHFEPVEYFGGEDSFKNQQQRDKRKLELSKENDITLIYVNYWEDLSPELVKEKVDKVLQEREKNENGKF